MSGGSSVVQKWLLFCRSHGIRRPQLEMVCVYGSRRIEAVFSIRRERYYNASAEGKLLGAKFSFEAFSRRRLPGDEKDSTTPLFDGTFNFAEGVSGDFVVRPDPDGELMTLGVYGAPHAFQLIKSTTHRTASPVELRGMAGWEVRFEDPAQYEPAIPKNALRAAGNPRHYSGYCSSNKSPADEALPTPGVLVATLLVYQLLLKPFYLTEND
jgi:hypothetical protein